MTLNITEPLSGSALFWSKGFRPFFIAAAGYAIVAMLVWSAALFYGFNIDTGGLSYFQWHAHELLYGYGGAVIAGFLLTAAVNWTGRNTLSGFGLQLIFLVWLGARIGWLLGGVWLWLGAMADGLFWLMLMVAIARPIIQVKQWRQLGILAKLTLLFSAHILFVLDAFAWVPGAAYVAIYIGLFTIIGLILVMLRRVFPFFVKAASGGRVELNNPTWIDRSSLVLFVLFMLVFFIWPKSILMPVVACAIGLVLLVRLLNWFDSFIFTAPLLWSLYVSYGFIVLGCWLFALSYWHGQLHYLAIHAWSLGGFGMATLGMLVRVSVGHSGRNVRAKRPWMWLAFMSLIVGVLLRVILPMVWPAFATEMLIWSQVAWLLSFVVTFYNLVPLLTKAPSVSEEL
ncbi:MAG: NnrS family protein [Gammaproteobacteria bacterium]|nr:NnrS family protein [Gammaproteobacteria bacterium]